MIEYTYILSSI